MSELTVRQLKLVINSYLEDGIDIIDPIPDAGDVFHLVAKQDGCIVFLKIVSVGQDEISYRVDIDRDEFEYLLAGYLALHPFLAGHEYRLDCAIVHEIDDECSHLTVRTNLINFPSSIFPESILEVDEDDN